MPKNRVDELESTVCELESTIEGLTEELVESKERIRVLEDLLQAEPPTRVPERRGSGSFEAAPDEVAAAAAQAESADEDSADEEPVDDEASAATDSEPQESRTDDIIVA
ncbi:DUF7518 family protein [Halovivax gelatinilyticus]|uniref:DUF7518 family protein n=1 Tax=Halovivax gelatinilyticus TaxID=2961597 RepID=UPI0020CA65F9|nr:hypothetical protein [Halovivax gelatinilyticus]